MKAGLHCAHRSTEESRRRKSKILQSKKKNTQALFWSAHEALLTFPVTCSCLCDDLCTTVLIKESKSAGMPFVWLYDPIWQDDKETKGAYVSRSRTLLRIPPWLCTLKISMKIGYAWSWHLISLSRPLFLLFHSWDSTWRFPCLLLMRHLQHVPYMRSSQ